MNEIFNIDYRNNLMRKDAKQAKPIDESATFV